MDEFNVIAGLVTIVSLLFSVWVYFTSARAAAVETERHAQSLRHTVDLLNVTDAATKQASLIVAVADREDVTKKEIKHLVLSMSASLSSLRRSLEGTVDEDRRRRFGSPSQYLRMAAEARSPADDLDP